MIYWLDCRDTQRRSDFVTLALVLRTKSMNGLGRANVALCQASEKLQTPSVATADFCYFRLKRRLLTARRR